MKIVPRDAVVRFRCKMCGSCCRRLLNLEITAYDIVNWWELGRKDIIAHLVAIQDDVARSYGVPFIFTFPRRGDGSCIYLLNNLCSIHNVKPLACRIYPFGLGPNYELIIQEECKGLGEGDIVDIDEIIKLIRKHLAGIEALKIPKVRDEILRIVTEAKRDILRRIGCLENLDRIEKCMPDYVKKYVFMDLSRFVYMLYYGDVGELALRISDIDVLARWFAENTKDMSEAVSVVHIHTKEDEEEKCRGVILLYSTKDLKNELDAVRKRCLDMLNNFEMELTTVFLKY